MKMTKKEFKKRMSKARRLVILSNGCCDALEYIFYSSSGFRVINEFNHYFAPYTIAETMEAARRIGFHDLSPYWLGHRYVENIDYALVIGGKI